MISVYLTEIPFQVNKSVYWNVSIAARNDNIPNSLRDTTEAVVLTKYYNPEGMDPIDYANLSMGILNNIFTAINTEYESDWWVLFGDSELLKLNKLEVLRSYGSKDVSPMVPRHDGYVDFNGITVNQTELTGHVGYMPKLDGGSTAQNPLDYINGEVNLVFPIEIYDNITLNFNQYKADNSSGSVSFNGTPIELDSIKQSLL